MPRIQQHPFPLDSTVSADNKFIILTQLEKEVYETFEQTFPSTDSVVCIEDGFFYLAESAKQINKSSVNKKPIVNRMLSDPHGLSRQVRSYIRDQGLKAIAAGKSEVTIDCFELFKKRAFIKLCQHKIISAPKLDGLQNIFVAEKLSVPNCA